MIDPLSFKIAFFVLAIYIIIRECTIWSNKEDKKIWKNAKSKANEYMFAHLGPAPRLTSVAPIDWTRKYQDAQDKKIDSLIESKIKDIEHKLCKAYVANIHEKEDAKMWFNKWQAVSQELKIAKEDLLIANRDNYYERLLEVIEGNKMLKEKLRFSQEEVKQQAGQIYSLEAQNKKLIYQNKDLQNGIESLKEDNRNLDLRNTATYNIIRDLRFEKVEALARVKELEAALARAEGLNRPAEPITKPNK